MADLWEFHFHKTATLFSVSSVSSQKASLCGGCAYFYLLCGCVMALDSKFN